MDLDHNAQLYDETQTNNFINFFHTIKDLLFILDMEGKILKVNQAVVDRLGYSEEELIGQSVLFVHPDHRKVEAYQNVVEMLQNKLEYCPIPLIAKDGSEIPVETRVTLGVWDGKQVLFGVCKDISELKLSEEKFYKVFQNSASLIAITSRKDGRYLDVNQTFCDVLGYQREEVIGITSKTLDLFKNYEDRARVIAELEASGRVGNVEVEVKDKNNVTHIGLFNAEPIYIGSEPCLATTMVDVTFLKKLEREIKTYNTELKSMVEEEIRKRQLIDRELENQVYLTETLFNQPSVGIFFMMLDEPIAWNDSVDKAQVMEYVFEHHRITKVNQAMLDQYGAKLEDFIGSTPNILFAHDLEQGKRVWEQFFDDGHLHTETLEQRFDGSSMNIAGDYICMYDSEGRIIGHFGIQLDVTEQKLAQEEAQKYRQELAEMEERYRIIAESAADVIWVFNFAANKYTYFSPSIQQWLGYSVEEALELTMEQFMTPEFYAIASKENEFNYIRFLADKEKRVSPFREMQLVRKDGSVIWTENSSIYRFNKNQEVELIGISRNIDERKHKEEEIQYLMTHDTLTGLRNRNALLLPDKKVGQSFIGKASAQSILIINLDKFRIINETLGHPAGDHLLQQFAEKITESVGQTGTVYRSGGDEFLVVINTNDFEQVDEIARKTLNSISRQINLNRRTLFLSASIGAAIGKAELTFETLLRNADTALFVAKRMGNTVVFYAPEMSKARTREQILTEDLQHALENGELELWYQPVYDVSRNQFNQAEALIRWNHPEYGRVCPDEFIPIAEKTKLIIPITDWVINEACKETARLHVLGIRDLTISVNLSLASFENKGFELIEQITDAIRDAKIHPAALKIEITERVMLNRLDEVMSIFQQLKKLGVKLALDDFGVGYSSFGHLRDIPFDIVKIDRSLIENISKDSRDQMIFELMSTILHGLGMEVVAEGVETQEQLDQLVRLKCDFIQGYFFSKPLSSVEFEKFHQECHQSRG